MSSAVAIRLARALAPLVLVACRATEASPANPVEIAAKPLAAPAAPPPSSSSRSAADAPRELPSVTTEWCVDGLRGLDEDVCYVLPPLAEGKPRRLMIYFHGIVPPVRESEQKTRVELAVLHASTNAGAAALVPRGRRGIGPAHAKDWWAWPTDPRDFAALAPAILARVSEAKAKLEALAGAPFERTYLAGSSNGAYFVATLALGSELERSGLVVDGFGVMSGGATGGRSVPATSPRPFYLGFGRYDEETVPGARALAKALEGARWPVRVAEHPFGHGAKEIYVDEAFAFWGER